MRKKNIIISFIIAFLGGAISAFGANSFEQKLQEMGINRASMNDLSGQSEIVIAQPSCAYINITGIDRMPWSKTAANSIDMKAEMEIFDGNGNYFKKKVLLNAQGNSSMGLAKKNFSVDFCEDDWLGDTTTDITIGHWVTQDSFHFKAYYNDFFRGTGAIGYKFFDLIVSDHSSYLARAGFDDTGARCYPDGFPCVVYLNGEFQGVFAWQLKKNRKNMGQNKSTATHIHLDGTLGNVVSGQTIDWTLFEVRNPKTLYCTDTVDIEETLSYKKVNDEEELAKIGDNYTWCETKPSDLSDEEIRKLFPEERPTYLAYQAKKGVNFYKLEVTPAGTTYAEYDGDHPKELIDETMPFYDPNNKGHVLTAQVKHSIEQLNQYYNELKNMENSGASDDELRAAFEQRFDVQGLIDYKLFSAIICHNDGFNKNWQWFTYDGIKWFVVPYDLDSTFGYHWTGNILLNAAYEGMGVSFSTLKFGYNGPCYFINKYYYGNLLERYKALRSSGVFDSGSIVPLFEKWQAGIGRANYADEWEKWPESPCVRTSEISDGWATEDSWMDYNKVEDFDPEYEYNAGDRCRYMYRVWTATKTIKGVLPCTRLGYTDSTERVRNYLDERLALADIAATFTPEDFFSSYTLSISAAQWATVCVPFSFRIPEGVSVYTIESVDYDGALINKSAENFTEANKPYLVNGPQGTYILTGTLEDPVDEITSGTTTDDIDGARGCLLTNGLLKGTYEDIYVPKDMYVLQNHNGMLAFYHVSNDDEISLTANHAYLSLPSTEEQTRQLSAYRIIGQTDETALTKTESSDRVIAIYSVEGISKNHLGEGLNIVRFANGTTKKIKINKYNN